MSADIVVIRACSLQESLGPSGFLAKQKLRVLRDTVETMVPPEARATATVNVNVTGTAGAPLKRTYAEIVADLGDFENGIPLCDGCPASGGKPVGCYAAISYPIDAFFEEALFDFVVSRFSEKGSPAAALVADVLPGIPSSGSDWHTRRGKAEDGALAARPEPFVHSSGGIFSKKRRFDSAQLLSVLFHTVEDAGWIAGMTLFVLRFAEHAVRRPGAESSRTLAQFQQALRLYAAAANLCQREPTRLVIDG
jgi:hypothetical protein